MIDKHLRKVENMSFIGTHIANITNDSARNHLEKKKGLKMTSSMRQEHYILSNLGVLRGMLTEIDARRTQLKTQLYSNPTKVSEIKRELGPLEGEMDAVVFAIDFIENLPVAV
jgi:hypothetical protein